jgi:hypothetical protein
MCKGGDRAYLLFGVMKKVADIMLRKSPHTPLSEFKTGPFMHIYQRSQHNILRNIIQLRLTFPIVFALKGLVKTSPGQRPGYIRTTYVL